MSHQINHANVKEWAKTYDGEPFDAILCDPPYELGFMGKSWDSTGISNDAEMWGELLRICKPGAFLLAFSGSRTYHRMACAIEDAGFEIRDMVEWVYGSGFPKSLDIGKAIDKAAGAEREVVGYSKGVGVSKDDNQFGGINRGAVGIKQVGIDVPVTAPATEQAIYWQGYGTALKPAHEPICMARKPFEGTVASNVLEHGTGGLNIDGCRVEPTDDVSGWSTTGSKASHNRTMTGGKFEREPKPDNPSGRFPANLIHDGSDEAEAVFPFAGDTSAARFFYCAKANKSERNAGLGGFEKRENSGSYEFRTNGSLDGHVTQAKANMHPTVKPLALTKYLATLIKPPTGGRLLVPFSGSGSEMIGALQAGWEHVEGVELTEEYIPIALARIDYWLASQPLTMFET